MVVSIDVGIQIRAQQVNFFMQKLHLKEMGKLYKNKEWLRKKYTEQYWEAVLAPIAIGRHDKGG